MAGASGQSDLGLCSESEDGVWISVECVEHICGTKKQCVIQDMKQRMIYICHFCTHVWIWCNMKRLKIWIWLSKILVDRSIPLSTCSRLQFGNAIQGRETWCSWTTTWWCTEDVLLKAHGYMRSPGSRVRSSEPPKMSTGGITNDTISSCCFFLRPWLFKSCSLMETCRLQGGGIFLALQSKLQRISHCL